MTPLFKKLNLKDESAIVVLNAPESFEGELEALEGVEVHRSLESVERIQFAIAFAITRDELDKASLDLSEKAEGDVRLWIAYPKKSSKKYTCEFNRDSGWAVLGRAGFEGVRMVAIDEDWSALRFRKAEFIKSMKRDPKRAVSKQGKARTKE